MATTKRLIEQSLRTLGVLATGEEGRPAEIQDGLLALRQMLDSWSTAENVIHVVSHETLALDGTKRVYTIGEGADWDTPVPRHVKELSILQGGSQQIPCEAAPLKLWEGLTDKLTTSGTPRYYYFNEFTDDGVATISFSATPLAGDSVVMASLKPLSPSLKLTEEMELPAPYEAAIRFNLAIELADEYGKQVSAVTATRARDTLMAVKKMNHRPRHAKVDRGITGGDKPYNVNAGPA